jgi:predicted enzyme related to lactoylglutathione lyase
MNLKLSGVMIGTTDPKMLAEFYAKVFGKKADWEDGKYYTWQIGDSSITVGEHSEVHGEAKEPARVMFNFETKQVKEEAERIKEQGAAVVAEPYKMGDEGDMWIATFADPDGNYFQLASPWDETK